MNPQRNKWVRIPHAELELHTAETDATFYEKIYVFMTKNTLSTMARGTPDNFQISVKVPETVTYDKRRHVDKEAICSYRVRPVLFV